MTAAVQNTTTSGPSSVSPESAFFGTNVELMSPDYIMWYVAQSLSSIGAQLDDYKRHVDEKRAKAEEIQKVLAEVTTASAGGRKGRFAEGEYDKSMAILAQYKEDEALNGAYEQLLRSHGGYVRPDGKQVDGLAGGDHDSTLNSSEWNKVIDQLKQSLEALNSDNELTMMKLQTLMQQRNQVSQFASNMLNALHENSKAILSNLRV
jgi:hypothetical protein